MIWMLSFFQGFSSAYAADVARSDYMIGAGDLVRITVYSSPDLTTEARVTAAGTITFPLLGEIKIGDLSPAMAEKKLVEGLEQGGFIKQAQVNLVVLQFQSQFISVLGDVYKPGRFPLDRPSNLSDVLALAGGPTPNGSDIVTIVRTKEGKTTKQDYDLRELLTKGNADNNPKVIGDDIVYVNAREVSVLGQVNRPGKYSVVGGVRSVLDFLSQAGGISSGGADKIIVITNRNGKTVKHEIDVDQLYRSADTKSNFELASGDSIYVPRTPVFYIYGEVQRPGAFRLERNMTLAQALSTGGGLTGRGTERGVKIKRMDVSGKLTTISANPSDFLQVDDVVYIGESLF
ncbi:MAG: SLBB domain-containing protein [Methylophilaceae bacterium]|nr:SLBB domain-containing protein [Methylophilaceae bacterium]